MDNHGNYSTNAIGFCLLPSELIHNILLYLALPEIMNLKSLNKTFAHMISDQEFKREYNTQSRSTTWLFVYKKRWHHDAILHGFTNQSNRWFNIQISNLLKPMIFPGENIYFLAASGNFFLFASNTRKEVIAVNLVAKTVRKIPPSPLGPRGTSLWRRSGMKLISGSDHFRFFFAEIVDNHPILFVYTSETDTWQSKAARQGFYGFPRVSQREGNYLFLNVINGPHESMVLAVGSEFYPPVILRPRFDGSRVSTVIDMLYVYGDAHMLMIRSDSVGDVDKGVRMLYGIELLGLGLDGDQWEHVSKVPCKIMEKIRKPHRVMSGCLERKEGLIKVVLLSNYEGLWDIIWLSYDLGRSHWTWVPLPDCKMKGLNMAGIAFSSGLTLS